MTLEQRKIELINWIANLDDESDLSKMEVLKANSVDNVPEWHKDIVRERLADYKKNPSIALDFEDAMDDIEKNL